MYTGSVSRMLMGEPHLSADNTQTCTMSVQCDWASISATDNTAM